MRSIHDEQSSQEGRDGMEQRNKRKERKREKRKDGIRTYWKQGTRQLQRRNFMVHQSEA